MSRHRGAVSKIGSKKRATAGLMARSRVERALPVIFNELVAMVSRLRPWEPFPELWLDPESSGVIPEIAASSFRARRNRRVEMESGLNPESNGVRAECLKRQHGEQVRSTHHRAGVVKVVPSNKMRQTQHEGRTEQPGNISNRNTHSVSSQISTRDEGMNAKQYIAPRSDWCRGNLRISWKLNRSCRFCPQNCPFPEVDGHSFQLQPDQFQTICNTSLRGVKPADIYGLRINWKGLEESSEGAACRVEVRKGQHFGKNADQAACYLVI
ncbi:hypothetical protein C8R47DRAFT_1063014 [Mycena vitilis]|nr:hypothetical protein C8R47DRAFT_1063014 [Mycena vitilis]